VGAQRALRSAPVDEEIRWRAEQAAFTADHLGRQAGGPRRRVKVVWWSASLARGPDVSGLLARLWSGRDRRPGADQVFVALFEPEDPVGARPFLVLRARDGGLGATRGRALATVHGQAEPGGVLVVETRAGTIVPAEPPAEPGDDAPSWTETDPR
jgi:hypothetical protein